MAYADIGEQSHEIRDTRFAYRRPGPAWLALLVLLPALLAAVLTLSLHDRIEDDIAARSEQALVDAGIGGVEVHVAGREVEFASAENARIRQGTLEQAGEVIRKVDGVGSATIRKGDVFSDSGRWLLFGEVWVLLAVAFLLGSLIVWLIALLALPSERRLERETGLETEGVLS